jgi:hypothetical protein
LLVQVYGTLRSATRRGTALAPVAGRLGAPSCVLGGAPWGPKWCMSFTAECGSFTPRRVYGCDARAHASHICSLWRVGPSSQNRPTPTLCLSRTVSGGRRLPRRAVGGVSPSPVSHTAHAAPTADAACAEFIREEYQADTRRTRHVTLNARDFQHATAHAPHIARLLFDQSPRPCTFWRALANNSLCRMRDASDSTALPDEQRGQQVTGLSRCTGTAAYVEAFPHPDLTAADARVPTRYKTQNARSWRHGGRQGGDELRGSARATTHRPTFQPAPFLLFGSASSSSRLCRCKCRCGRAIVAKAKLVERLCGVCLGNGGFVLRARTLVCLRRDHVQKFCAPKQQTCRLTVSSCHSCESCRATVSHR